MAEAAPTAVASPPACEAEVAELCCLTGKAKGLLNRAFKGDAQAICSWLDGLCSAELQRISQEVASDGGKAVPVPGLAKGSTDDASGEAGRSIVELLPEHVELEVSQGHLQWLRINGGWLALAGAPGGRPPNSARQWHREGATVVVSLLKEEEDATRKASESCERQGLMVERMPLSGRQACFAPRGQQDVDSWRALRELMPLLLSQGHRVVVHCSAGMHRTGCTAYLACRRCGLSPEEALQAVERMRPVTHEELLKRGGRRQDRLLWELAEAVLEEGPVLQARLDGDEDED
mmetsp:Transcript_65472/g.213104  ORF Transcript_65472/g.213104 Transcript_65472/m.213104 type:complete len:291 (-) Transcript_65472:401-1273(-)